MKNVIFHIASIILIVGISTVFADNLNILQFDPLLPLRINSINRTEITVPHRILTTEEEPSTGWSVSVIDSLFYNSVGKVQTIIRYYNNVHIGRYNYVYNDLGQLVQIGYAQYDQNSEEYNTYYIFSFSYNEAGNISYLDFNALVYNEAYNNSYFYNTANILSYEYEYTNQQMLPYIHELTDYSFSEAGRLDSLISRTSGDSLSWDTEQKITFSYNESDNSNYESFQNLQNQGDFKGVVEYSIYEPIFPIKFNEIKRYHYYNGWNISSKTEFLYDEADSLISQTNSSFYDNTWSLNSEIFFNYYPDGLYKGSVIYQPSQEQSNTILTSVIEYITLNGTQDEHQLKPLLKSSSYPNPFSASTTLKFDLNDIKNPTVKIYNIKGELVKTITDKLVQGKNTVIWNGTNEKGKPISNGIYFMIVTNGNHQTATKLVKIK